jgi:hypothetical protein
MRLALRTCSRRLRGFWNRYRLCWGRSPDSIIVACGKAGDLTPAGGRASPREHPQGDPERGAQAHSVHADAVHEGHCTHDGVTHNGSLHISLDRLNIGARDVNSRDVFCALRAPHANIPNSARVSKEYSGAPVHLSRRARSAPERCQSRVDDKGEPANECAPGAPLGTPEPRRGASLRSPHATPLAPRHPARPTPPRSPRVPRLRRGEGGRRPDEAPSGWPNAGCNLREMRYTGRAARFLS